MNKNIIITTGGTGGHIISGLTISKYLINLGNKVTWIGTKYRMESNLVFNDKIKIDYINICNFNNQSILKKIIFPFNFINSILEAKKIIEIRKPNIILGMGGYISVPACIAGWIKNIPIIIHEQNSIIGLSNKLLYFLSSKFLSGFNFNNKKYIFTGNPIRKEIINIPNPKIRLKNRIGPIRILILGGSQGSEYINYIIPIIIKKLNIPILIWHQVGKNNTEKISNLYFNNFCKNKIYSINDYILNINYAYEWSDLVICRSGALTVSEISYVGLPAIFIPFINKDKHQYFNALFLEKIGVAKIFNENINNINLIYNYILNLNRNILFKMSIKCRKYNIFISIKKIINEIINL